jgi:hypothetical protein
MSSLLKKSTDTVIPFEKISQIAVLPEDSGLAFFTPIKEYYNETIKATDYSQPDLSKKPKHRSKRVMALMAVVTVR